ncbi:MAG: ABC transporter substrate-binding protein, partial [Limisphaerales bacterium]
MKNEKPGICVRNRMHAIFSAAIALALTACGNRSHPAEKGRVTLGAVLPLTGNIAEYGKRCKAGADYAVAEINSSGGVTGKQIAIIYEDDAGDTRNGVNAIQKLISIDHVNIVVGAVASSVTLAIEPIATRNRVILFSPAASSPKLTGISPFFFRDWPSDVYEATVLAEFVHNDLKLSRVAILYVNNEYGIGLKDEFNKRFLRLQGQVPVIDSYEQNATDFRAQLTKIQTLTPQAIYLAGYHREMAVATRQLRDLGIPAQILGDADYGVQELLQIAGS